ncbi:PREDICTED: uncharacterized protein KIAA1614 homolog [Gekko japonicus]|uniref:Uncharacterized protein KIAA1614 homolog n=1 Tax=Gekko japonicus TaxID=146911 RepID=A0ABM1KGE6_GEKJA|nr:PREDICTED: uncharacterized protein KIAA1614 homolog [Gekko japonicus]
MEGNFSTERRRAMKNIKQCARNIPRLKQPPESPEGPHSAPINGPSWVPVRLSGDTSRGTSVLVSKVKALKEKKGALNKQGDLVPQERASPKKAKARKGKPPPTEPAPQDMLVEPQSQIRTYLTDGLLDSTPYPHLGPDEVQEGGMPPSSCVNETAAPKGPRAAGGGANSAGRTSPQELQRLPGRNALENKVSSGNVARKISQNGLCGAGSSKDLPFDREPSEEANGKEDHRFRAMDSGSSSFPYGNDTCGVATTGRLWRAESWDSLGSGGSNASSLSLAERVERNRAILQEMLSVPVHNSPHPSQEGHSLLWHKKETPVLGNERPGNEILANDVDGDSGVSLQDLEGFRAFVPDQELELSPRHEQAKQLLQRARMKARTNPLRANHSILPAAPQERRDACGFAAVDTRNFALKDGDSHASGNLSDSSSGDSSCGQQGKRGPSPSRVRFEDESARDAEVRYLERLQQRQKRVLDSVLLSLGQGPLASKPDLSDYINGDLQRKQNEEQPNTQQSIRGRSEKGKPLMVNMEGKCSACGSYITNAAANQNPDARVNSAGNVMPQTCNIPQESKNLSQAHESKELSACQEDSRTRTLGPKGTPLWILPSRQRVYTERIRETYIGEVTCIDDVDSALDSTTDTSDSYRTDSEEAGTNSCRMVDKNNCRGSSCPDPKVSCPSEKGRRADWERHRVNGVCSASGVKIWDTGPRISRVEIHSTANETCSCNFKGASEVRGQVTTRAANGVEAFPRVDRPVDQFQLTKKGQGQGHTRTAKAQLRQPTPAVHSQQVPSQLDPDGVTDSLNGKPAESSDRAPRPTNNLSQTAQITGQSQQLAKHTAAGYNLVNRVPAPPSTGKALSSPLPYRRAVLTGPYEPAGQDPGLMDSAKKPSVHSASPSSFQEQRVPGLQEQCDVQPGPKRLSKGHLLALSTNNCNNTQAKGQPEASVTSAGENGEAHIQDIQKLDKNKGLLSSSCAVPPATPNAISSTAIALSLTAEEANSAISTQSHGREVPKAEAQKTKPVRPNAVPGKPLETYPEPNKKPFAKKGGTATPSSSTSGLKKFFTSLSQSTKQRLGRFRCYSMEQISALGGDAPAVPEEAGAGATSSPKMKKAPSLQSLRLVSPFNQPRKSSSVQNLHSLLGKTDRSSLYQLGEPKDGTSVPDRKAGAHPRRSLSVEDIGSPNLLRTVGRVVEVFPDGTSQLELQRLPQGTFGFRVSSGNGRPDTGLYVQEMADASTAKLYAGLLGVGDEILELNGAKVAGLGLAHINEQLLWADTLSVRVLRQRPVRR